MKLKWKISLYDKYLLKNFFKAYLLSVGAIVLILITSFLFELAELIIINRVSFITILKMVFFRLPEIIVEVLPISILFGSVLGFGSMVKNNEVFPIIISGKPFWRVILPILLISFFFSGATFGLKEYLVPLTNQKFEKIYSQVIFAEPPPKMLEETFFRGPSGYFFYIGRISGDYSMEEIMIFRVQEKRIREIISSKKGYYEFGKLNLVNGNFFLFDEDGRLISESAFSEELLIIGLDIKGIFVRQKEPAEMSRRNLRENIITLKKSGFNVTPYLVAYNMRLANPFSGVVFALIGTLLSSRFRIIGFFPGIATSIGLAFFYYIISSVSRSLGIGGVFHPLFAAWAPIVAFIFISIGFILKE